MVLNIDDMPQRNLAIKFPSQKQYKNKLTTCGSITVKYSGIRIIRIHKFLEQNQFSTSNGLFMMHSFIHFSFTIKHEDLK